MSLDKRKLSGFTLIELLVTVIIIIILATIILPSVDRCKEQARRVVCTSNLKQLHTGLLMYVNDWYGWFPRYGGTTTGGVYYDDLRRGGNWVQLGLLYDAKYIDNPRIFYCPSEKDPVRKYPAAWKPTDTTCDGNYDYWGGETTAGQRQRDSIRENPGKALIGDLNISWGDIVLQADGRTKKTHVGEGQNVLHIGGDVKWYPRNLTKSPNSAYKNIPITDFSTVDN